MFKLNKIKHRIFHCTCLIYEVYNCDCKEFNQRYVVATD